MTARSRLLLSLAALTLSVSVPAGSAAQALPPCPDNYCLDAFIQCREWGHPSGACRDMQAWCDGQCRSRNEE